jgi:hypothetical protein
MPQATNVVGSTRLKQTFEIVPQFAFRNLNNGVPEYADDTFNPSQPIRVSRRFSAPTNYTIRVLATSYD